MLQVDNVIDVQDQGNIYFLGEPHVLGEMTLENTYKTI